MNEFIGNNMQVLLMGASVLIGIIVALTGIHRYDAEDGERSTIYNYKRLRQGGLVLFVGLVIASTAAFVPTGNRGVVFGQGQGIQEEVLEEGLAVVFPFWERVHNVNVQTQLYEYESFVQTRDLQEVTLPIAVNFRVVADEASKVYQEVGRSYVERIIAPAAFQASTEAAGQILAESIAQSRAKLASDITDILRGKVEGHGIFIESVSVKDAVFDGDFINAIKAKVIADQKAEESARLVEVALNEASQVVATAQGAADALAAIGLGEQRAIEAVASALDFSTNEYLLWQRLQVWDGALPETVLGGQDVIVDLP
ncbi:hypothetical protein LCGC14_1773460 [marine sediment metagenome]|uniref:Band 7 domain-containing protein n=1 Tax=marine sediment metagenome TaxID=412755 RepID=A0A0F9JCG9_9ZZZZ